MSLAVAIEAGNGIVLAADSRATFGDPRGMTGANDSVPKIYKPNAKTALAMVGQAEIAASLIERIVSALAANPGADVDGTAETIRIVGTQCFNQWFGAPIFLMGPNGPAMTPRPDVGFMLVGYDLSNRAKIINIPSVVPFFFAPSMETLRLRGVVIF
jgi:hypothetical protein